MTPWQPALRLDELFAEVLRIADFEPELARRAEVWALARRAPGLGHRVIWRMLLYLRGEARGGAW